jgi:hypothetical protein
MARDVRRPERHRGFLLPADRLDRLPQDDIVPLVQDAVSLMDLSQCKGGPACGRRAAGALRAFAMAR